MHLPVHCCVPRSAEEDLEASRRQDDAVRAAGRVLKGRSGQFGSIAYLEDDGTLLTGEGEWLLAAATRRFFTEVAASDVYPLAALPANPTERLLESNDTVLSLVAQEMGHRWGASVRFRDASGRLRRDLQGREGSHWSFFLDSGASALEGNRWEHIGRYHWSLTPTDGYSPLDQYLMGLRPPEEVPPARLLRGARDPEGRSWSPSSPPGTGVRLEAAVDEIPLRAIVEAEGSRDPPPRPGKQFRHAFVLLLQRHEGLLGARVRQLDRIRGCWEAYFFRATEGRATLSTAR